LVFRGQQRPVKAEATGKDGEYRPAPHHVLQCQLQMDAAGVDLAYLECYSLQQGIVFFEIRLDSALLASLNPVLLDISDKYLHADAPLPPKGFTQQITGHPEMVTAFVRAMSSDDKCWKVVEVLQPAFRGISTSSSAPFLTLADTDDNYVAGSKLRYMPTHLLGLLSSQHGKVSHPLFLKMSRVSHVRSSAIS
jgi:hypothetical protein